MSRPGMMLRTFWPFARRGARCQGPTTAARSAACEGPCCAVTRQSVPQVDEPCKGVPVGYCVIAGEGREEEDDG